MAEVTIYTETLLSAVGCMDINMFEKVRSIYEDIPDELVIHIAIKKHYDKVSCPVCRAEPAIRGKDGELQPGMRCRADGFVTVKLPRIIRKFIERKRYAHHR